MQRHIVVIDPGISAPELDCYNRMTLASPLPMTYHMPALHGWRTLDQEDQRSIAGMMILGSGASVNDRLPWQDAIEAWVMPLIERGIPTLGLCYGHQMLAYLFGGKIGFAWENQEKAVGLREITLNASPLAPPGRGQVVVSHRETVVEVPPSMEVFASSPKLAVEALRHRHLPVYSFQSHPEATATFLSEAEVDLRQEDLVFGHRLVQGFLDLAASPGTKH